MKPFWKANRFDICNNNGDYNIVSDYPTQSKQMTTQTKYESK